MDGYRSGVRAVGLVLGAWGFLASLFLSFFLTFRVDAWQIFGKMMLPIIILLCKFNTFCWNVHILCMCISRIVVKCSNPVKIFTNTENRYSV